MKPNWKKYAKQAHERGRKSGYRKGYDAGYRAGLTDAGIGSGIAPIAVLAYTDRIEFIYRNGETSVRRIITPQNQGGNENR